jgi:hypothetical protein
MTSAEQLMLKGELRGNLKAKTETVLEVLAARGLPVPNELESRIRACVDRNRLQQAIRIAVTCTSIQALETFFSLKDCSTDKTLHVAAEFAFSLARLQSSKQQVWLPDLRVDGNHVP